MAAGFGSTILAGALFLGGVALVVVSVETFVESVADAALGLGVSAFLLTVLLAGVDLENAVLGLAAAVGGLPGVALGTVFGEALFVLGAALGVAGVVAPFETDVPRSYLVVFVASPALFVLLSLDGTLSRLDGIALTLAFLPLVGVVYRQETSAETRYVAAEEVADVVDGDDALVPDGTAEAEGRGWRALAVAVAAVVGMTAGSELAVEGARGLLASFEIPGLAFGATVLSVVASLEELVLTVTPVRRGRPHLAVGNVVGSLLFFVTANAGVIALVRPLDTSGVVLSVHWPFLAVGLVLVGAILARGRVGRPEGSLLLAYYAIYWGANYLA